MHLFIHGCGGNLEPGVSCNSTWESAQSARTVTFQSLEGFSTSWCSGVFSLSEGPVHKEDSALARWVADPANTAWMESEYHGRREPGGPPLSPLGTVCICQPQPIILLSCVHSPEVLTRADCVDASPGPREAVTFVSHQIISAVCIPESPSSWLILSSTGLGFCHKSQRFGDWGINKALCLVIPDEMTSHGAILKREWWMLKPGHWPDGAADLLFHVWCRKQS